MLVEVLAETRGYQKVTADRGQSGTAAQHRVRSATCDAVGVGNVSA
jgi:hypothetical protein